MKYLLFLFTGLLTGLLAIQPSFASDKLNVFACETEWAALAHEIGGDALSIYAAANPYQDPHRIQARPSLIAKARTADVLICAGADLEIGWLPLLLKKSGNAAIQPDQPGYFMATDHVELLGKLESVDRSMGDVHGAGNPHIHFDPRLVATVAQIFAQRLGTIAPEHAAEFSANAQDLVNRLNAAQQTWQPMIDSLNGKSLVVHHKNWDYLVRWLSLNEIATLEPKPGITPSTKHLSSLKTLMETQPADVIIYSSYQNKKAAQWLSKRTGITAIEVPYSVEKWQAPDALINWYTALLTRLSSALEE